MSISVRRLRAVLLFAVISAVAWAIVGTIVVTLLDVSVGISYSAEELRRSATMFGVMGFAAGATWAVVVAMMPGRRTPAVGPRTAALAGALAGLVVIAALMIASGSFLQQSVRNVLISLGIMGGIGGSVGLLIQRVSSRGRLPPTDQQDMIEP